MNDAKLTALHFGDLHLWRYGLGGDFFPKRFLGIANLLLRRARKFPPRVAELMQAQLASEMADFVFFSGDLATTSLPAEFEAGARWLEPLRAKWGERLLTIPGNHDRYTPRATREKWFERHVPNAIESYPYTRRLNATWTLISFDCSVPHLIASTGKIDQHQLTALDAALGAARAGEGKIIVMGHYNIVNPPGVHQKPDHMLVGKEELGALLKRHGVEVYIHGHTHTPWYLRDDGLIHLNCGSAGQWTSDGRRQPSYLKFVLGPDGLKDVSITRLMNLEKADWKTEPLEIIQLAL